MDRLIVKRLEMVVRWVEEHQLMAGSRIVRLRTLSPEREVYADDQELTFVVSDVAGQVALAALVGQTVSVCIEIDPGMLGARLADTDSLLRPWHKKRSHKKRSRSKPSCLDMVVEVLETLGHDEYVDALFGAVNRQFGIQATKSTIATALYRDAKLPDGRVVQRGRGIFGLRRWGPGGHAQEPPSCTTPPLDGAP